MNSSSVDQSNARDAKSSVEGSGTSAARPRWLAEFFRPALRCERVGHKMRGEWRRGYVRPETVGGGWGVVAEVRQEREVCERCRHATAWETVKSSVRMIHSFSSSPEAWDAIREDGGYWDRSGRKARQSSETPPAADGAVERHTLSATDEQHD